MKTFLKTDHRLCFSESVKDAAGNLTEKTIARHSQMVGVGKLVRSIYEKQVSGLERSGVHSKISHKREKDILEFTKLLVDQNLFSTQPGRKHTAFPEMDLSLYSNVVPKNVNARLVRLRKEMAKRREICINNVRKFCVILLK